MSAVRYAALDLETVELLPESLTDGARLPGIACAAIARDDTDGFEATARPDERPELISGALGLTRAGAADVVGRLAALAADGYTLVTWNGVGCDFRLLAHWSGEVRECSRLALASVDMMFSLLCECGYPLALATALAGMGLPGKDGLTGSEAPAAWRQGRFDEVIAYCGSDARTTVALAHTCADAGRLRWTSQRGRPMCLELPDGWLAVREALSLPLPDTSWMDAPLSRAACVDWLRADDLPQP